MNPPNPNPPPATKILRRPVEGRKLFGVAQSLADYLVIDATIVRILFVVCGFLGGSGIILYLAGAILIPSEDGDGKTFTTLDSIRRDRSAATIVGLVVAALGSIVLLGELSDSDLIAPLLLVAVGCGLLLWKSGPSVAAAPTSSTGAMSATGETGSAAPPSSTGYPAPPVPNTEADVSAFGTTAAQSTVDSTFEATSAPSTPYPAGQSVPPAPAVGAAGDVPWVPPQIATPTPPPSKPKKQKRPRSKLTWLTMAGLLMYFGIAIVLNESGALNVDADRAIAWGLAAVGGVLAYTAFFGRARWLIPIGLLMIPVMFAAGEASDGFSFDTTRVEIGNIDIVDIGSSTFDRGVGSVEYDLRSIELDGETETIDIDHGFGEVIVRVPADVALDIEADVGAGDIDVLGRSADGPGAGVNFNSQSGSANGTLALNIDVGFGKIEVTR